jgi:hypothetical protein
VLYDAWTHWITLMYTHTILETLCGTFYYVSRCPSVIILEWSSTQKRKKGNFLFCFLRPLPAGWMAVDESLAIVSAGGESHWCCGDPAHCTIKPTRAFDRWRMASFLRATSRGCADRQLLTAPDALLCVPAVQQ